MTRLAIGSGVSALAARTLGWLARGVWRLPESAAFALLIGALGGFPTGAVAARELSERGELTREEASRLVAASNNAGLAFCVGGVGASLLGSARLGLYLWVVQLAAGALICRILGGEVSSETKFRPSALRLGAGGALRLLAESVSSSGAAMLGICSFAVFFGVVADFAAKVAPTEVAAAVVAALLEPSTATQYASELGERAGLALCGFAVGFGGVSVQAQIASVLAGSGISQRRCFAVKLAQGVTTAAVMLALAT